MLDRNYKIRESKRAKHVLLNMSPRNGLVVVVPEGFDLNKVPGIVEKKRSWIEKAHAKVEPQRKHLLSAENQALPECITLRSIGERWEIEYSPHDMPHTGIIELDGNRLSISRAVQSRETVDALLLKWLACKTKVHLKPRLCGMAEEHGFRINRVLIKSQKTRWGSCSGKNNISINLKLLFLPEELVGYVFLHELCHTVHLNHSPEFWRLLEKHVPEYDHMRKQLRNAWCYIPAWLDPVT